MTISGLAGLHAGENAGAPRGEALVERIAERVDLAEQAEYLVIGGDEAGDDHVVGDAELGGAGMKLFLDLVDAANEGADIDDQRLEPALLSGWRRSRAAHWAACPDRSIRNGRSPAGPRARAATRRCRNFESAMSGRRFDVRRQRRQHALSWRSSRPADPSASSRRTSGENMTMVSASSSAGM